MGIAEVGSFLELRLLGSKVNKRSLDAQLIDKFAMILFRYHVE